MITPNRLNNNKSTRVIFPTGEIRQFRESVSAAEIMLKCPNFFLVNSESLSINGGFSALSADEELESGNIYIMFPMRRLNSIITPADLTVFWMAANNVPKRISVGMSSEPVNDGEEMRAVVNNNVPEFSHRLVVCKSRKPLLDTITEEHVSCR